jgi:two-component system phosphate regulon sensor histidine kinase PhoR
MLSAERFGRMADSLMNWCQCLEEVHFYFRYDFEDGALRTTATDLPDTELVWARDTVISLSQTLPPPDASRPRTFGLPSSRGTPRDLSVIPTHASDRMIFAERLGQPKLIAFAVVRDREGKPLVAYGYQTEPRSFLKPLMLIAQRGEAPLPKSLLKDLSPDSVLSISVAIPGGDHEIYRSSWASQRFMAVDTLGERFGKLVLRTAIDPRTTSALVVGGLPGNRVPLLLLLVVLTAGLLFVALFQLRRHEQLARLRTDFVSGVSHELRTPLAQIRWFAELLQLGKLRTDEERARSAAIIDQDARRLTYLVENVLSFSRSEKGAERVAIAPTPIAPEINGAIELFLPLARSRRMTVQVDVPVGLMAMADRNALRQIVLNLLDNAAKYGPAGQTIRVRGETVGHRVRLTIEDEGPGVPASDRDRIWEPYVRLNRDAEAATGGSGIGLSVVRELVTMQHGTVTVDRADSGGARFIIDLQAADDPEAAIVRAVHAAQSSSNTIPQ